ncbi:MAG: Maf family protein [Rhodothermales bacterium]
MIILASGSPRRQSLLAHLGVSFEIDVSNLDEVIPDGVAPKDAAEMMAVDKARSVAERHPDKLVLAADTIVVLDGTILGKPDSPEEARRMLRSLSGRTHAVYTGVALVGKDSGREVVDHEKTLVTFSPLTDDEIDEYVASGSPFDKAGAYGIQDDRGALFVCSIEGDYYNVMGLPVSKVYRLAREHFPDLRIF